jgi:hypothetical protein
MDKELLAEVEFGKSFYQYLQKNGPNLYVFFNTASSAAPQILLYRLSRRLNARNLILKVRRYILPLGFRFHLITLVDTTASAELYAHLVQSLVSKIIKRDKYLERILKI